MHHPEMKTWTNDLTDDVMLLCDCERGKFYLFRRSGGIVAECKYCGREYDLPEEMNETLA